MNSQQPGSGKASPTPLTSSFTQGKPSRFNPVRESTSIKTSAASFILGNTTTAQERTTQRQRDFSAEANEVQQLASQQQSSVGIMPQNRYRSESPDTLDSYLNLPSHQAQQILLQDVRGSLNRMPGGDPQKEYISRFVPTSSNGINTKTNAL